MFTKLDLEIPDASVTLYLPVDPDLYSEKTMIHLQYVTPWEQKTIWMYGKEVIQPRLICYYGDHPYTYSGQTLPAEPIPSIIRTIVDDIKDLLGFEANSVLLNLYPNGDSSIGFHSDDETELGHNPIIVSLTLGAERSLIFKHKDKKFDDVEIVIPHGGILVMEGETQTNWRHGIPKTKKLVGPRLNLTFRKIIAKANGDVK